jgi:hypothetical protein
MRNYFQSDALQVKPGKQDEFGVSSSKIKIDAGDLVKGKGKVFGTTLSMTMDILAAEKILTWSFRS